MGKSLALLAIVAVVLACGLVNAASAAVNLEFRPFSSAVNLGDTVELGLYAVASSETSELVSSIDAVIIWDPSYLGEVSLPYDPPEMWLFAAFSDFALDGINDALDDGNALYTGWANMGEPIQVTQDGTLCDVFSFQTLAPAAHTSVSIAASFGQITYTSVLDGTAGNKDITGSLGSADVSVVAVPEPASLCLLTSGLVLAFLRKATRS